MAKIWYYLIQIGKKTIDDVPITWKSVQAYLLIQEEVKIYNENYVSCNGQ